VTAHDWGGIVIHDATTVDQAEKAVSAGVDGLMLVCAGAGGLDGLLNPFAFVARVRAIFDGIIQLAGGIATGRDIAAAQVLGADMVCMGTRFIATLESGVADGHKQMLVMIGVLAGLDGSFDAVPLIMRNQTLSPVSGLPVRGTDRRRAFDTRRSTRWLQRESRQQFLHLRLDLDPEGGQEARDSAVHGDDENQVNQLFASDRSFDAGEDIVVGASPRGDLPGQRHDAARRFGNVAAGH
jgi:hypothetical protein